MMVIGLTVADEKGLYKMKTRHGFITMDDGGWAKPVDPQFPATVFKDEIHDKQTFIAIMSGPYKGHFLGGDYIKGIGAYPNWRDAAYITWNNCILTSLSGLTKDLPITYGSNGFFYFYRAGRNYESVCVDKVPADDKPKGDVKDEPSKGSMNDLPPKGNVKEQPSKGNVNEQPSKGSGNEQPSKGNVKDPSSKGDVKDPSSKGDVKDPSSDNKVSVIVHIKPH